MDHIVTRVICAKICTHCVIHDVVIRVISFARNVIGLDSQMNEY